ncbi:hypothetical protein HNQ56_002867 [Anaerotaenia torta]|uniref:hypothetical protein n=1 Tax=Anaerotaenia torta TaxID=433293 RepID=UPI003D20BF60
MANKKNSTKEPPKQFIDLFYMTPAKVSAADIGRLFHNTKGLTVELWTDMDVMELVLPNGNSVDLEAMEVDFQSPSDAAFVKNRGIQTIFAITLCEADLSLTIPYFEQLTAEFSGFVCADSEDFTPVYAGSSKR